MKLSHVLSIVFLLSAAEARAEVPALLPVQGYLTLADGTPIDGPTTLHFSLYATDVDTTALYAEEVLATIDQGLFSVYLGERTPLPLTVIRDAAALWLGMAVGDDPELTPRVRLATMPFAASAQFCAEADTLNGATAADFAPVSHTHDWSELTSIPADIADGDADTTYSAGGGLQLNGTTFSVDNASVQSRVNGSCPVGSSIRAIADDGTVTCETDNDSGGTITGVTPGAGLTGGGTSGDVTLTVDQAVIQRRVTGTCPNGQYMQAVNATGTVNCDNDSDTMANVQVGNEFTAQRDNNGTDTTNMVSATRSFCFLTRYYVREVDSPAEGATCRIVNNSGTWRLEAVLDANDDADVACSARCVTW